jgi:hypothetical protein
MRYTVLVLAASLAACTYQVTTPAGAVSNSPPRPELAIGVADSSIVVSEDLGDRGNSDGGHPRSDLEAPLLRALISQSGGAVAAAGDQALRLFANLTFEGKHPRPNDLIGIFSFFLPPLAFIPESVGAPYVVDYALRDREDRTVFAQKLEGSVDGAFKGWYIARIKACQDLFKEEQEFAAQEAARMVLSDVFAHASQIDAARNQPGGSAKSKPAAGAAPAAPEAQETPAAPQAKPAAADDDLTL